jgi:hypothetical protein
MNEWTTNENGNAPEIHVCFVPVLQANHLSVIGKNGTGFSKVHRGLTQSLKTNIKNLHFPFLLTTSENHY